MTSTPLRPPVACRTIGPKEIAQAPIAHPPDARGTARGRFEAASPDYRDLGGELADRGQAEICVGEIAKLSDAASCVWRDQAAAVGRKPCDDSIKTAACNRSSANVLATSYSVKVVAA